MKIWLESTEIPLIEKGVRAGLLHGIVTTPTFLIQHGKPQELVHALLEIQPGPVVVDFEKLSISPRTILRIPSTENDWESIHKTPNALASAIFTPVHALLAATAGAAYVSPHLSRMLKTGDRPLEQIESIQKIINTYKFQTQMMVLHPKSLEQVKACAEIGAAGIIVRDDLYKELLETHELAAFHVEQSHDDLQKCHSLLS